MTDDELDELERTIPALMVEASRGLFAQALTVGSVLIVDDDALIEVFPDGRRVFIKALPPSLHVAVGTTYRAKS